MDTILKPNCAMDFWINSTIHCRHLTTVEFNPSCLPLSSLPLSLRALKEMSQELQCIPPPPPTLRSRSRGKKLSFPSHLSYPECSLFRTDLPCNSVPRWVPPPPPPNPLCPTADQAGVSLITVWKCNRSSDSKSHNMRKGRIPSTHQGSEISKKSRGNLCKVTCARISFQNISKVTWP